MFVFCKDSKFLQCKSKCFSKTCETCHHTAAASQLHHHWNKRHTSDRDLSLRGRLPQADCRFVQIPDWTEPHKTCGLQHHFTFKSRPVRRDGNLHTDTNPGGQKRQVVLPIFVHWRTNTTGEVRRSFTAASE